MNHYTPFETKSSYPLNNAQSNLAGRTHYVDTDTLKFFKARVLDTGTTDNGLLFWLIESFATDDGRKFRGVIFDIFGNTHARRSMDDAYKTAKQAKKALWADLNELNAVEITRASMESEKRWFKSAMDRVESDLRGLEQ